MKPATPEPLPTLSARDLRVSYEAIRFSSERRGLLGLLGLKRKLYPVLTSLSFEIPFDHKLAAIVGPNGAGKTTLLRAISGDMPSQGDILWAGQNINLISHCERAEVGVTCVLHENGIFPNLTVTEHIKLIVGKHESGRAPIDDLIERLRLRDAALAKSVAFLHSSTRAGNLSGGERKILSFLRLIFRPWSLVLLDEPTSGLSEQWLEVYAVILEMLNPACVVQAEQYSRAELASHLGATLYELKEGGLCRMERRANMP